MIRKLTPEEQDDLSELSRHEGAKALLVEIDNLVSGFEQDVLKHPLDIATSQELLFKKARLEGAVKLALAIHNRLNSIRKKS